ncbi:hypothetical protein Q5752_006524 [Cryptotrichosporon argae]
MRFPSTSSSPRQRTGKAGISWPVQEHTSDPVAKFFKHESRLSWHYNWNKDWAAPVVRRTSPGLVIDADFVPMIFSIAHLDNGIALRPDHKLILGFNEPDHRDPAVATYLTPQEAAKAWERVAKLRSPGVQLVSPAIAGDVEWLKQWFALIPADTRPDILAVHVYTTTFDDFRRRVEAYRKVFGLPIMVTEFAMQSFDPHVPPPRCMQQVHDFMGQTTQWLDATPWIVKYAWFGAVIRQSNLHGVHPFNRLMDETGEITPLGQQYIAGGHT